LSTVLRDALLAAAGLDGGRVAPERAEFAARTVGDRPPAALLGALAATRDTIEALRGNVAPALTLEHLMLALAP
jgi:hypothetical protein